MRSRNVVTCLAALLAAGAALAGGTVEEVTFYSEALGMEKPVQVYLPEGYDTSDAEYPVVYFVHGMSHHHLDYPETIQVAEEMIESGWIDPFILVKPEAGCLPYVDAGYPVPMHSSLTNSELNGRFEDYFVEDLVEWVDNTYRTDADRDHRFVTGHSWGGYSSMRVALRHPDVFSKGGSHAGPLAFEPFGMIFPAMIATEYSVGPPFDYRPDAGLLSVSMFAAAASFSPNPTNPPFYVDLALDEYGQLTAAWDAMAANSNTRWAAELAASGSDVDIYFDCGTLDGLGADYAAQYFSAVLQALGVDFTERWFEGDHWDHIAQRMFVHYSFFMPMSATADAPNRVFNPNRWWPMQEFVLELPGDLEAELFDVDTIAITAIDGVELDEPLQPLVAHDISDVNGNGQTDLTIWFARWPLRDAMAAAGVDPPGEVAVTLRGETTDELFWEATETLFVPNLAK